MTKDKILEIINKRIKIWQKKLSVLDGKNVKEMDKTEYILYYSASSRIIELQELKTTIKNIKKERDYLKEEE